MIILRAVEPANSAQEECFSLSKGLKEPATCRLGMTVMFCLIGTICLRAILPWAFEIVG